MGSSGRADTRPERASEAGGWELAAGGGLSACGTEWGIRAWEAGEGWHSL